MNTQMKKLLSQRILGSNSCRISVLCLSALCLFALPSHAATITVTSSAGIGAGTLHQALADANDGDTINFALTLPAYIQLYVDPLEVDKSVTISGPGAAELTVLGTGGTRVFNIAAGKNVTISGLTVMNGVSDQSGGGIYNDHSSLTLNNCNIVHNFTGSAGGGIYNTGTLTVNDCTISNNDSVTFLGSEGAGAGIYNDGRSGYATVNVANSTISNNDAQGAGGGIYNNGEEGTATLTVTNSSIDNNSTGYEGGGIYNAGIEGAETVTINASTLSGNSAAWAGGGIASYALGFVARVTLTINNSTLDGNSAGTGGGIFNSGDGHGGTVVTNINNSTLSGNSAQWGGGVANEGGEGSEPLTITNSTLSGNSASISGGAIVNADARGGARLTIGNTILKTGASGENIYNESVAISLGYNLSDDDSGGLLTAPGDRINTDPMVGPLQDNGGPTFTHALLPGSPAIDAGKNFAAGTTDQRGAGFVRTSDSPSVVNANGGDGTDIGAYEVQVASYAGQVQPPINADGSSTFNVRRGVVPVKFNLTLGGVATCDLPPAAIAVTRTAGGVIGQVNESVYSGNADSGSNFRIDSCQYGYNLNARALGVGTYRVDILIGGQVIGSASFGLN